MSQPTDPAVAAILARMRGGATAVGPLPDLREDPNYVKAGVVKQAYIDAVAAANADPNSTDIDRAAAIVKAWNSCIQQLAQLRNDLDARRQARADQIGRDLPLGPGIPAATSPADRVVLMAAFNAALDRARKSNEEDRRLQLKEAERFGDTVVVRAVLTSCLDDSLWNTIDRWATEHDPAAGAAIREWKKLSDLISGYNGDMDVRFEQMQFSAPPRPSEVFDLPAMVAAHNSGVALRNGSSNGRGSAIAPIDLGELLA